MSANTENDRTLKAYEENIASYIEGTPKTVDGPYREWLDSLLAQIPNAGRILEVGSAFGRDADYIESQGFKVERTDAAQGFVDYLIAKGHEARLFNVVTDDINGQCDLILANAVFLHFTISQLGEVLDKCRRALKQEGILAFSVKRGQGSEWDSSKLGAPKFYQYWDEATLIPFIAEHDLQVFDIRTLGEGTRPDKWLNIVVRTLV